MRRISLRSGELARDRRGVAALEYAFVVLAAMALFTGVLQIGYCLYAKAALNLIAAKTARMLQTGSAKDDAAAGMANFGVVTICGIAGGLLDCSAISVSLYPVQDYLPGSSNPFNPGIPKSLMLLRLTYTLPIPTWPLQIGSSEAPLLVTTTLPFMNEY